MKKIPPPPPILLIYSLTFALISCTQKDSNENSKTIEVRQLVQTLKDRFTSNDYEMSVGYSDKNPYNHLGKNLNKVLLGVSQDLSDRNKQLVNTYYNQTKYSYASYNEKSLFRFTSGVDGSMGLTDSGTLEIVHQNLTKNGSSLNKEDFSALNDRMLSYTFDRSGIEKALNDKVDEGAISEAASDILKVELQELSTASTNVEAQQINQTFETEVINSGLTDQDKKILLILAAQAKGASGVSFPTSWRSFNNGKDYHNTGASVIIIGLGAMIGAVISTESGGGTCGSSITNTDYDRCVMLNMAGGAALGTLAVVLL
ncbi:MAG: hypothetical protein JST48_10235 [Bacteroidetes bacterium]|nr:hypothetical protein [Bacteroidota bacterium]